MALDIGSQFEIRALDDRANAYRLSNNIEFNLFDLKNLLGTFLRSFVGVT